MLHVASTASAPLLPYSLQLRSRTAQVYRPGEPVVLGGLPSARLSDSVYVVGVCAAQDEQDEEATEEELAEMEKQGAAGGVGQVKAAGGDGGSSSDRGSETEGDGEGTGAGEPQVNEWWRKQISGEETK